MKKEEKRMKRISVLVCMALTAVILAGCGTEYGLC